MKKKIFLNLIGIIIFVFVLINVDLPKIISTLSKIDLIYFISAVFLLFPIIIVRALRWNYIKRRVNIYYPLRDSFLVYFASLYVGMITPGRLGEFIKVRYLQNKNSFGKSLFSVLLDRLSDLLFLLIFGYVGLLIFDNIFKNQLVLVSYVLLSVLIVVGLIFSMKKYFRKIIKIMVYRVVPGKYLEKAKTHIKEFYGGFRRLGYKHLLFVVLLTILSWVIYFIQINFLSKSIGITLPFLTLSFFVTITGLITMIPISISGVGTRDLMMILFFSYYLISKEMAIAFSALILLMSIIAALIGLICLIIKPPKL